MNRESGIRDNHDLPIVVKKYDEQWGRMMIDIWKNRIKNFEAIDTGRLHSSVTGGLESLNGMAAEFRFRFVEYGIHVENGVGNGYYRGNPGDLPFLNEDYRLLHGYKGDIRHRRPWFSPSWWYSRRVIAEQMVDYIGDAYVGMFDNLDK